jgi:hypothetical protein
MSPAQLQLCLALVERMADRQLQEYLDAAAAAQAIFDERAKTMTLLDTLRREAEEAGKAAA